MLHSLAACALSTGFFLSPLRSTVFAKDANVFHLHLRHFLSLCIHPSVQSFNFFSPPWYLPCLISPTAHFYRSDTTIFLSVSSMTLCFLMITSLQVRTRSANRPDQIYTSTTSPTAEFTDAHGNHYRVRCHTCNFVNEKKAGACCHYCVLYLCGAVYLPHYFSNTNLPLISCS